MQVAQPAPSTPRAGNPHLPNMSTQLETTFTRLAVTSTSMIPLTRPIPCR